MHIHWDVDAEMIHHSVSLKKDWKFSQATIKKGITVKQ